MIYLILIHLLISMFLFYKKTIISPRLIEIISAKFKSSKSSFVWSLSSMKIINNQMMYKVKYNI